MILEFPSGSVPISEKRPLSRCLLPTLNFGRSSAFDLSPKAVVHEEPVVVGNAPRSQPFWYKI